MTARAIKPTIVDEDVQEVVLIEEPTVETKTVQVIDDGRVYDVEVLVIDGRNIVQESVYKEVPLPYSKRTTKILVAAAGTQVR